ncbi:MAG: cyanophycinase [Bacteroidota bacterium]
MTKIKILFLAPLLLLSIFSKSQTLSRGSLVIVGGGLEHTNKSVYNQLIALAGGIEKATFAVIPSASGVSVQSYMSFRNILISYGVKPENIHLISIAMVDDDSTVNVNESDWRDNGNDLQLAAIVRSCSAVWFSGGDQSRTMKTLLRADGSQTPVLEAVWDVYRSGGVIGGTSAGAAIMSEVMIGGGTSLSALSHGVVTGYTGDDFPESLGVWVTKGLGFFPHGLVDQHFNARARIGRLAMTLMNDKKRGTMGFGVDENTAVIYDGNQDKLYVAGVAGVTILNTSDARISYAQNLPNIENLRLSYLEEGDTCDFTNGIITPAKGKRSTKGKERYNDRYSGQEGILSANVATFRDLITIHLTDNKATDTIRNITFFNPDSGFQVSLYKTPESEGFCPEKPNRGDHYTVTDIRMDITSVHFSVIPVK